MGDRCYLRVGVLPKDSKKFEEVVDTVGQPDWDECGLFTVQIDEEADFGAGERLTQAAEEGLVFYGYHGPGDGYPAAMFASNGDGSLYFINCLWHDDTGPSPVVEVDSKRGELLPGVIADARETLAIYNEVKAQAFPEREKEDLDFEETIRGLIAENFSNSEIVDQLDRDTAVEDLVALTRKLLAEPRTVTCKFCGAQVDAKTAHRHEDGWVGDECCWDERLRSTE